MEGSNTLDRRIVKMEYVRALPLFVMYDLAKWFLVSHDGVFVGVSDGRVGDNGDVFRYA